ncbi:MAG: phosphoribosylformylglycinamidine cyclo-ligase [Chloroflexota bacterium]
MSRPRDAYAASGVDLSVNVSIKEGIRAAVDSTRTSLVQAGFGSFGGAFSIPPGYHEPVLVSSVDGVGTKLHLSIDWGRPEVAGRDVVNHCINDVAVLNARPLAFLDYIASGELDADTVLALVEGMAHACRAEDIALIGGETAQMPDTYRDGAYDVAGTMIGIVERAAMPDPAHVQVGDVIVGVPSVGLHTNGYSLARKTAAALGPDHPVGEGTLADALLAPHPSYLPELRAAFADPGVRVVAHITGGGLEENVPRVLPEHLGARFDVGTWSKPPVFDLIAQDQGVDAAEMYRVFNMGIGLAIVVAADAADGLLRAMPGTFLAGVVIERDVEPVILAGL